MFVPLFAANSAFAQVSRHCFWQSTRAHLTLGVRVPWPRLRGHAAIFSEKHAHASVGMAPNTLHSSEMRSSTIRKKLSGVSAERDGFNFPLIQCELQRPLYMVI
jgi:hypothetical protein